MDTQNPTGYSYSEQLKQDTFVSDESIVQFQEDVKEAEKERIQSGQRRKELLNEFRNNFQNKDYVQSLQESKKEKERLLMEGSTEDIKNIAKQFHREIQTYYAKKNISKKNLQFYHKFQNFIQVYIEKKNMHQSKSSQSFDSHLTNQIDNSNNVSLISKDTKFKKYLEMEINKLSSDVLIMYQNLDERINEDSESESFLQSMFYSIILLLDDRTKTNAIRLCKSKCQNASIEIRIAVYRKLIEQLAGKNKHIAKQVHQLARAAARKYEKWNYKKLAIKELCYVTSIAKDDTTTYRLLYRLFTQIGDKQKAFITLRQLHRLNPNDIKLHRKVAQEYYEQGNIAGAINEYKVVIEHPNAELLYRKELAKLLIENRNYSDVPTCLDSYLELFPQDNEARKWLAVSYMNCEVYSIAAQMFELLLEDDQEDIEIVKHLVFVYRKLLLHFKAIELLTKQIKNHPDQMVLKLLLGGVFQDNGDWHEAAEMYNELLKSGFQSASLLLAISQVKIITHEYESALNHLRLAVSMEPQRWDIWMELGMTHRNMFQYEDAEDALEKAHSLSGHSVKTMSELIQLYTMMGKWEQALIVNEQQRSNIDPKSINNQIYE